MTNFTIHTINSAPKNSLPLLEKAESALGFIPNLFGVMAESPQLLEAYLTLDNLAKNLSFNSAEITVVWQTVNTTNECHYCIPAHTAIAKQMKVADEINNAVISNHSLNDDKLEALRLFAKSVVEHQGKVPESGVQNFLNAGYTQQNILEVVLLVGQKTLSNYTNYFAQTPIDNQFK